VIPLKWHITFDGITYKCINCAYCCSCENWRIYLSYFDYLKLKDYNKYIEDISETTNYFGFKKALKKDKNGCKLLKNNLCRIHLEKAYEYKPTMCRLFPFSFTIKWNGDYLLIIKHYCKGIYTGNMPEKILKESINCCKELYADYINEMSLMYSESSTKCLFDKDKEIYWEERDEYGKYLFGSENFEEYRNRYFEIFNKLPNNKKIDGILYNLKENNNLQMESEILRFMRELNKREHFRKLPFINEVDRLLSIGYKISRYKNIFYGEGEIDKRLFFYNSSALKF